MGERVWMSVYWLTVALNVVAGGVALYFAGDFMLGLLLTNHEFSWTPLFYSWIPLGAMIVLMVIGVFAEDRA